MTDVVVLGPASWNQIVPLPELPQPRSQTLFAASAYETLGGTSAGKALHLTDLGRSTELLTVVGEDHYATRVVDALERAGVSVVAERAAGATERHLNLMTPAGQRVSIYLATVVDPPKHQWPQSDSTVVLDLSSWTRELARDVRRGDRPVWTDLHDWSGQDDFHRPLVEASTHVFLSGDGPDDPVGLLHELIDEGVSVAVCTLGARGAVAVDAAHVEWTVAAEPAAVVDTNGAGDAFFAGVLHATLDGTDLPGALRAGARQAVRALECPHLSPRARPEP